MLRKIIKSLRMNSTPNSEVGNIHEALSNYKIIYLNLGNPIYTVFTLLLIAIFYYTIRNFLETKCSYKFLTNLLIFLIVSRNSSLIPIQNVSLRHIFPITTH